MLLRELPPTQRRLPLRQRPLWASSAGSVVTAAVVAAAVTGAMEGEAITILATDYAKYLRSALVSWL